VSSTGISSTGGSNSTTASSRILCIPWGLPPLLAIIIAAFGLLGMATYSTRTRIKEIGIRKVFGAEANHIMLLVSRSYLWLMLIAAIIGGTIAYLVNNLWLQNLSKKVDFGVGNHPDGSVHCGPCGSS
jgi:ABC-type antimicrobial peptide transport system permease subunit